MSSFLTNWKMRKKYLHNSVKFDLLELHEINI